MIIYNLGRIGRVDIEVEYGVQDFEGNVIASEKETLAVEMQVSVTRSLDIPFDAKSGNYVLYVIVRYDDIVGTGSDIFKIMKKEVEWATIFFFLLILIILMLLVLLFLILYKRKERRYVYRKESVKTLKDIKKRIRRKKK